MDAVSVSEREKGSRLGHSTPVPQVMAEKELGKGDTDHDQEIILKILKVYCIVERNCLSGTNEHTAR